MAVGRADAVFLQQQRQLGLRLGVTGEQEPPTVGGRDVHIEHLHGGKLLDHTARGQPPAPRLTMCMKAAFLAAETRARFLIAVSYTHLTLPTTPYV